MALHALRPLVVALMIAPFGPCADGLDDPAEAAPSVAEAEDVAEPSTPELHGVTPSDREPLLDLPDPVRTALRERQWDKAAEALEEISFDDITGRRRGTLAFLRGWALIHAGRAEEVEPLLDRITRGEGVPEPHAALVRAEVRSALGNHREAIEALDAIPESSAVWLRGQVIRAESLRKLDRTKEAFEIYRQLIEQPDPTPGVPEALLALAQRAGHGSDEAYPLLRRVWVRYPKSDASREGWPALKAYGRNPTWQERAQRAYIMMRKGWIAEAHAETLNLSPPAGDTSDEACMLLFTKGRTTYRKNQLANSVSAFGDIGERCPAASEDWGARGLYLIGMAQFRRGLHKQAAAAFAKIPELYPASTYADDGWLHAGIALQEAGQLESAREHWLKALEEQPDGDTTPESTWRLAWSWYLDGDAEQAIAIAERLGALSLHGDRRHVESGRYWAARWQLYPDVDHPTVPSELPGARERAVEGWEALCRELPHSYYSVLAFSRLVEVAPERAQALRARPEDHVRGISPPPWQVRPEFYRDPAIRAGVDLARMGLVREARESWARAEHGPESPDEHAWLFELQILTGDWLMTHDAMRSWLEHNPPGTLGERQPWVIRVGYPDRYWAEVQEATEGYSYDPRLFHALVREESNFNRKIRSHAGAIGLSQLMPATAKQTAGWMRIPVGDLDDPSNNLKIGARYLESVLKSSSGSPFLALAGYNAGPGRVRQWLTAWGNVPTDEYVERIPFRETRGYVRRVTTTWQTYRFQFDESEAFPDLSEFNHQAKPE
ncbi:MAG: hypothetical protein EA397_13990 [Deltaproteobacteria bacterium]|nr:MAG: hypothetical protein EA397_13990 [Deltaproteobacteria bacterium]